MAAKNTKYIHGCRCQADRSVSGGVVGDGGMLPATGSVLESLGLVKVGLPGIRPEGSGTNPFFYSPDRRGGVRPPPEGPGDGPGPDRPPDRGGGGPRQGGHGRP